MASILEKNINMDLGNGYIAKFHDESPLNSFVANKDFNVLAPEFCFEPRYPQLKGLTAKVLAVDKNTESKWLR